MLRSAAAVVTDPELASAMHLLGARLHERAGRDSQAATAFEAALAALPDERLARWGLLRLALRAGRAADAIRHGDELLAGSDDAALRAALARRRAVAALAQDEVEQATRALATVEQTPDSLVLEAAAETHERAGRVPEATAALRAWAAVEPAAARRAEVLHRLAHLEEGEDAVRALAEAAEADPGDADAAAELAAARQAAGDVEAAVALEHAVAAMSRAPPPAPTCAPPASTRASGATTRPSPSCARPAWPTPPPRSSSTPWPARSRTRAAGRAPRFPPRHRRDRRRRTGRHPRTRRARRRGAGRPLR